MKWVDDLMKKRFSSKKARKATVGIRMKESGEPV